TLVDDGTPHLNPEYYDEIRRLKEKGILFAAVTGRAYDSCKGIFEPVLDDILFVCDNGAMTVYKGEIISAHYMDLDLVKEIANDIEDIPGCSSYISAVNNGYASAKDPQFCEWLKSGYGLRIMELPYMPDDMPDDDVLCIALYHETNAEGVASQGFYTKYHNHKDVDVVCSGKQWMNVCQKHVDKGTAVIEMLDILKLKKEEVIVVGDNMNDIGMLKAVPNSVAIGNARTEVKKAAKYVADTNVNDGVLQILKRL
ncbi:MAG: HAD family hydrolase, partial [Eubacteriales bacterium]